MPISPRSFVREKQEKKSFESFISAISSVLPATESDPSNDDLHRVFCIMGDRKRMVIGRNNRSITSLRWKKRMPDGTPRLTRHAEEHAIEQCRKKGISPKYAIVVRFLRNGEITMARPCKSCEAKLRRCGISDEKIYFSNWSGEVESL